MTKLCTVKRAPRLALLAGLVAGLSGGSVLAEGAEASSTGSLSGQRFLEEMGLFCGNTLAGEARQWVDEDEAATPDIADLPVVDAAKWLPAADVASES